MRIIHVYQNDWVKPVLTMINKANVKEERYVYTNSSALLTEKEARSCIVRMLMQPWFGGEPVPIDKLTRSLRVLSLSRKDRKTIGSLIEDYEIFGGQLVWKSEQLPELGKLVRTVLGITDKDIEKLRSANELEELAASRLKKMNRNKLQDICFVMTSVEEEDNDDI
ncbi:hypothetical protein SAMN02910446_01414 [Ruminococcus sp. YE78]|nr:hypothetical protein SAMN02910446_01414 [Ruminococcus sp. YE78]